MGSNPSRLQRSDYGYNTTAGSDDYRTSVKLQHYEFVCTTCARNYKHVSASIYCKSCQDHLCFGCLKWHSKYRDDHFGDLIGLDEMRKLGIQGPPVMPTEKCVDHTGELWNMFCQKDNIAGCQRCMDEKHRACGSVIPRSSIQIEAAYIHTSNDGQVDATNGNTPNDGQVGGKLIQLSVDNGQVGGIKRETDQSEDLQVGGKLRRNSADDGQVDGRKREPDYHSTGQRQYNDQVGGSKKINTQSIRTNTSYTDDGQVPGTSQTDVDILQQDDGQVSGTSNQHIGLYSVGCGREVNARLDSDNGKCYIIDIAMLSDGRLLMSDNHNKKLKLLDSNLNISHHCEFQHTPRGICMINDTEAAVAVREGYIQFVSIEDCIELGRRVELNYFCLGLAYSGGELFVSDKYTNIHVVTEDGDELHTLQTGLGDSQQGGDEWLTVSKDRRRIYLTNYWSGIVCLDRLSGEVIWKIKDTDDNNYTGVCVDRYNNAFVCRLKKHDVVQFSPSGQMIGVVINESDVLRGPCSICIDEIRNRLLVGTWVDDAVKMFDINS